MRIVYCHSCDELFAEFEMNIPNHCPVCGTYDDYEVLNNESAKRLSDRLIEDLWMYFGLINYDGETETILEDFLGFPAGTWREDVWHWFDKAYSKGVHELMYM